MNFLQLCQSTSGWSTKASNTVPSTVVNQVGLPLAIVNAVSHAWSLIQGLHENWQWMRGEFSATLAPVVPPSQARYTAASLGITRFDDWIYDQVAAAANQGSSTYRPMSMYKSSIGVADEGPLQYQEWEDFRATWFRGTQQQNRPTRWTADPSGNFCLGAALNDTYFVRGEYFKSEQTLAVDTDTPEMPSRFHMAIVWRAVLLLTERDEADQLVYDRAENKYAEIIGSLERSQLPHVVLGGSPIA